MAFETQCILMVSPGLVTFEQLINISGSYSVSNFINHMCHVASEFARVHTWFLIIQDQDNNASDWGLKWCNQCSSSCHAGVIMETSKEFQLFVPQLGTSTNIAGGKKWSEKEIFSPQETDTSGKLLWECSPWKWRAQMRGLWWERVAKGHKMEQRESK